MARTVVSFATCNLLNLNQPGLRIYRDSDGWSAAQFAKKIEFTSGIVSRVAADVWGFQELWHADSLTQVFETAGLEEPYTLIVPPGHAGQRIVCAGAVRTDIMEGDPEWIVDFPEKFRLQSGGDDDQTPKVGVSIDAFSRPVLHFRVRPRADGRPISVYVAHLKSKRPTAIYREGWYRDDDEYYRDHSEGLGSALSTIRRTAEAAALRMIITDRFKGNDDPVVILGDLNDNGHSNTLNVVTGQPNYLRAPWSKGGSDTDLYSIGLLEALRSLRDVYYTHVFRNTRETLDHILVSQEFYDHSRKRIWGFRGMEVINDHLNRDDHKESGSTDHGVICAEFEYRPA